MHGKPSKLAARGALGIGGLGVLAASLGCDRPATAPPADSGTVDLSSAAAKIAPLHAKMRPPSPGDWLARHREPGQTFAEYSRSNPNRPTAERTTIYVRPLGDFAPVQARLIDDTAAFLGRFFHLPVKTMPAIPLAAIPPAARRVHPTWGDSQILTRYVLSLLTKDRPADAVAVLALTTSDLWPGEGWNFVFGEASLSERVGVWSLHRYGDPERDYTTTLRRALKVASHETGHMFGIPHCIAYECGMNGSNSLDEADRRSMAFCPECEQKIWWATGADPASRYRSLAEFAGAHGLAAEAAFWKASLDAVEGKR